MTLLEVARSYLALGLSVIPIVADGSKRPALTSWKEYQHRLPTPAEVEGWFTPACGGIAIVCGAVSGHLEVLDFDSGDVWREWLQMAPASVARLPRVRTPSGGMHLYLHHLDQVAGNRKLAQTAEGKTLIETRGEGGYVLAPGCPPECHPRRLCYEWERELTLVAWTHG